MIVRRLLVAVALLLLLPVGGLTSLAYASPPDPSWISGIYDGADFDDVVVMLMSETAASALALAVELGPLLPFAGPVPQLVDDPLPTIRFSPLQSRAPPGS